MINYRCSSELNFRASGSLA